MWQLVKVLNVMDPITENNSKPKKEYAYMSAQVSSSMKIFHKHEKFNTEKLIIKVDVNIAI